MIAKDVTDFPEPDSPTKPRISPSSIEKLRSRTAGRDRGDVGTSASRPRAERPAAFWIGNSMLRLRTSSSAPTMRWEHPALALRARDSRGGCPYTTYIRGACPYENLLLLA